MHKASWSGDTEKARALIDAGADVNQKFDPGIFVLEPSGVFPLFYAAEYGHTDTVRLLIERGADVNAKSNCRANALGAAATGGHTDIVKMLLDAGAEVNVKDCWTGGTPLTYAVTYGHSEIVRLLLKAGADPGLAWDKTPLKIAQEMGYTSIARMLQEAEDRHNLAFKKSYAYGPKKVPLDQEPDLSPPPAGAINNLDFGSYHALVIGNNDYQSLPKLRTAINDARSMADLLEAKYGYEVELLLNATRSEIFKAIYSYRRTLTGRDNLLVYYAGHGWLDKEADEGYWLPVDAQRQDPSNWISNSSITSSLRAMKAKHVLVVADSCYSGKLARGISISLRSGDYYQRIAMKKARTVMASGGLEPVADDGGKGNHSVFASALIEALNENQGILDATLLFSKIRRPVMVNADQTPEYSDIRKAGHDGGDFLFVPR